MYSLRASPKDLNYRTISNYNNFKTKVQSTREKSSQKIGVEEIPYQFLTLGIKRTASGKSTCLKVITDNLGTPTETLWANSSFLRQRLVNQM